MNSAVYIHRNVSFFIHYTLSVSFLSLQPTLSLQHQHVYNALMSPEASQPPPVFSQYNSPYLLPSLSPSTPRPPYCHTLENSQRSASPSPPQNRAHRSNFSTLYQMGCTYSYSYNSIPKECVCLFQKIRLYEHFFVVLCVTSVLLPSSTASLLSLPQTWQTNQFSGHSCISGSWRPPGPAIQAPQWLHCLPGWLTTATNLPDHLLHQQPTP